MCVGNGTFAGTILWLPLLGTCGARGELPLVTEQVLEVVVRPCGGCGGPGNFQTASDGVATLASTEGVLPAKAHLFNGCALWLATDVLARVSSTVGLAEGVTTGDESNSLFVVHGHAGERLADIAGCGQRIGVAVGALWVDVDQAHLNRAKWVLQNAVALVATIAKPLGL